MKTCVKSDGTYFGTYHSEPPEGLIVVPSEPADARQIWDFVTQTWGPVPDSELALSVRAERNRRLALSDYTQLQDSPLSETQRAEWAVYRQALRDIAEQDGFPWGGVDDIGVPWPVAPEAAWVI